PDHLVVGREPEVATNPATLLVPSDRPTRRNVRALLIDVPAGRPAEHPRDGVVEEAEPAQPADRGKQEAHEDADVVLVGAEQVILADGDLAADPGAEEEAPDSERDRGEEVEPDQAPHHRRTKGNHGLAHGKDPPSLPGESVPDSRCG